MDVYLSQPAEIEEVVGEDYKPAKARQLSHLAQI